MTPTQSRSAGFSKDAKIAMQLALQEAQRFNHSTIGTEHLLLGIVKSGFGVSRQLFKDLEIGLREIRFKIADRRESPPDVNSIGFDDTTENFLAALSRAKCLAEEKPAGVDELLMAMLLTGGSSARAILGSLDVNKGKLLDLLVEYR